jgi:hypothetical protein
MGQHHNENQSLRLHNMQLSQAIRNLSTEAGVYLGWLTEYGRHHDGCAGGRECTCGWHVALRRMNGYDDFDQYGRPR